MTIFNMSFILEDIFQEVLVLLSVEFCSDRKLNHWKILLIVSGLVLDFSRARIIWCVLFSICDFFFFYSFWCVLPEHQLNARGTESFVISACTGTSVSVSTD